MYTTMIRVNSSVIHAVGYDGSTLRVEFNSGRVYDHPKVPPRHFEGLLNAYSKGAYYNQHIRGRYK